MTVNAVAPAALTRHDRGPRAGRPSTGRDATRCHPGGSRRIVTWLASDRSAHVTGSRVRGKSGAFWPWPRVGTADRAPPDRRPDRGRRAGRPPARPSARPPADMSGRDRDRVDRTTRRSPRRMPINPDAVGSHDEPDDTSWTSRDSILYALGVGAGRDELAFTTENSIGVDQRALPTRSSRWRAVGGAFRQHRHVQPGHARPRRAAHRARGRAAAVGEGDHGRRDHRHLRQGQGRRGRDHATSSDAGEGAPAFTNVMSAFIRGEGGWGGDRGP